MPKRFYRFSTGSFVEAATFEEAKAKYITEIQNEQEVADRWSKCTCVGFQHGTRCPLWVLPY